MKTTDLLRILGLTLFLPTLLSAQESELSTGQTPAIRPIEHVGCAGHELIERIDRDQRGFKAAQDEMIQSLAAQGGSQRNDDLYIIPVVFHIVYNNEEENLPDEVIENQIELLNKSFRRTNEDAIQTRPEFLAFVGDTNIEFRLADEDPEGNPTSGITRTNTDITHFGGLLPYGPGQNALISQWVQDSLIFNYFRMTNAAQGGADAWDTERYLNIWVGDMRIFEPEFDDFEEIVYFGLATPPLNIENWPPNPLGIISNPEDGVVMHYPCIGPDNPVDFAAPYNVFNGVTNTGKMLVHEVGHYLGLRHIWGDGNCSVDDFIEDTPNANSDSQWTCNFNANTCTDDIMGFDLPNMVENYMDYSSGDCQNAFTNGQMELMRSVLQELRPELAETVLVGVEDRASNPEITIYPNPTRGSLNIELGQMESNVDLIISNSMGQAIDSRRFNNTRFIQLDLNVPAGMYFLQLEDANQKRLVKRIIVE